MPGLYPSVRNGVTAPHVAPCLSAGPTVGLFTVGPVGGPTWGPVPGKYERTKDDRLRLKDGSRTPAHESFDAKSAYVVRGWGLIRYVEGLI